ncbi:hypothetical protein PENSPDRAFT_593605 [Peniophora sp. CONT]|nr:hypothetical protein PENSPDRAFT_593605 [Peniophora sp. CONT]
MDPTRMSEPPEDWDRSVADIEPGVAGSARVAFPTNGADEARVPTRDAQAGRGADGKRTLSELLKLHAEKGTDVHFTPEEAAKLEEVLGQWINSGLSPYEGDDDFFNRALDDNSISRRSPAIVDGRPRGQSESVVGKA